MDSNGFYDAILREMLVVKLAKEASGVEIDMFKKHGCTSGQGALGDSPAKWVDTNKETKRVQSTRAGSWRRRSREDLFVASVSPEVKTMLR